MLPSAAVSPGTPKVTSQVAYFPSPLPSPSSAAAPSNPPYSHYHIFFITGNPGCIAYYWPFLSRLAELLPHQRKERRPEHVSPRTAEGISWGDEVRFSVYGASMCNFGEDDDATGDGSYGDNGSVKKGARPSQQPLGLQEQIQYVEGRLENYIAVHQGAAPAATPTGYAGGEVEHKVIIVGHSVGAFIGLEIIRRVRERLRRREAGEGMGLQIVGFVGLWPSLTWIAESKSGRMVAWLRHLPNFAGLMGTLAQILTACLGRRFLLLMVKLFTGFPDQMARVTADFVASRCGVQQALHMGRDEMIQIAEDRWDEDIWGAALPSLDHPRPKLVFYFGTDDHWVADHTRDRLIAARGYRPGGEDWKPRMYIDDLGIPHSFCIRHSSIVARKTSEWIEAIVEDCPKVLSAKEL